MTGGLCALRLLMLFVTTKVVVFAWSPWGLPGKHDNTVHVGGMLKLLNVAHVLENVCQLLCSFPWQCLGRPYMVLLLKGYLE